MYDKTLVVNFFGGPCAGKSTMSGALMAELKWKGYDVEYAQEYAKDKIWENNLHTLENQIYVFAKQNHRMFRLENKVQIAITDSPILLSYIYYEGESEHFKQLILEEFKRRPSINIFLDRDGHYNENGRNQTLEEAVKIDNIILDILDENNIQYIKIKTGKYSINNITKHIEETYHKIELKV